MSLASIVFLDIELIDPDFVDTLRRPSISSWVSRVAETLLRTDSTTPGVLQSLLAMSPSPPFPFDRSFTGITLPSYTTADRGTTSLSHHRSKEHIRARASVFLAAQARYQRLPQNIRQISANNLTTIHSSNQIQMVHATRFLTLPQFRDGILPGYNSKGELSTTGGFYVSNSVLHSWTWITTHGPTRHRPMQASPLSQDSMPTTPSSTNRPFQTPKPLGKAQLSGTFGSDDPAAILVFNLDLDVIQGKIPVPASKWNTWGSPSQLLTCLVIEDMSEFIEFANYNFRYDRHAPRHHLLLTAQPDIVCSHICKTAYPVTGRWEPLEADPNRELIQFCIISESACAYVTSCLHEIAIEVRKDDSSNTPPPAHLHAAPSSESPSSFTPDPPKLQTRITSNLTPCLKSGAASSILMMKPVKEANLSDDGWSVVTRKGSKAGTSGNPNKLPAGSVTPIDGRGGRGSRGGYGSRGGRGGRGGRGRGRDGDGEIRGISK